MLRLHKVGSHGRALEGVAVVVAVNVGVLVGLSTTAVAVATGLVGDGVIESETHPVRTPVIARNRSRLRRLGRIIVLSTLLAVGARYVHNHSKVDHPGR